MDKKTVLRWLWEPNRGSKSKNMRRLRKLKLGASFPVLRARSCASVNWVNWRTRLTLFPFTHTQHGVLFADVWWANTCRQCRRHSLGLRRVGQRIVCHVFEVSENYLIHEKSRDLICGLGGDMGGTSCSLTWLCRRNASHRLYISLIVSKLCLENPYAHMKPNSNQ